MQVDGGSGATNTTAKDALVSEYQYVVTAQRPTAVTHALRANFVRKVMVGGGMFV